MALGMRLRLSQQSSKHISNGGLYGRLILRPPSTTTIHDLSTIIIPLNATSTFLILLTYFHVSAPFTLKVADSLIVSVSLFFFHDRALQSA